MEPNLLQSVYKLCFICSPLPKNISSSQFISQQGQFFSMHLPAKQSLSSKRELTTSKSICLIQMQLFRSVFITDVPIEHDKKGKEILGLS